MNALSPEQYQVTQKNGTERPFTGEYWDNHEPGIYVDVVSGEPLFASVDKFESGTAGRASPSRSTRRNVVEKRDFSHLMLRTEVRSAHGDSHLGHVFKDGPREAGRVALLHQLGFAEVHPPRRPRGGGLRRVQDALRSNTRGGTGMTTKTAILAGGCFWGMQDLIRKQPGVVSTRVGYTGGKNANATYRNHPGHAEAIEIVYDPAQTDYRALLEFFFQIHDPTTKDRQGNDVGSSYRSAIFYVDDEQKRVALDTIADVDASGLWPGKVVTEVTPAVDFWEAEPEHQDYLQKYPNGYTCHFPRAGWKLPKRETASQ